MVQQAFRVDNLSTSNIEFKANSFVSSLVANTALASNVHLVLPGSVGTSGQVLATDGSGNLSFVNQGIGGPADTVQDNVNATSANVNLVQSNVTSLTSTVDSFGIYANNTFGADGSNVSVANVTSQEFSLDGSTNTFTLVNSTDNVNKLLVSYGGIAQKPSEYQVSNTTLTLSNTRPLVSGTTLEVRFLEFEFAGSVTNTGNTGVVVGGSTTVIAPIAFGSVADITSNSGTNLNWSNWNSNNSTLDFTFDTPQPDTNYTVVTDCEVFDDAFVQITNKTTTGFRASFYDNSQNLQPSSFREFTFIVYGSTPTVDVNSLSGTSYSTTLYSNLAAGTTTFNANSTPALANYTSGKIGVYRNGVKLPSTDYTASDGTSLTLNNATLLGDSIEVVNFGTLSLALDDITDVDLTTNSPANGQALVYVSASSKWVPGTVAGSYGNSDVDAHLNQSTATTNQVLSWDGSDYAWVAQSSGSSLNNIQDESYGVSVTGRMEISTIDISSGINASAGATFDLQGTTINFGSATIAGGSAFNPVINNHLWSGSTAPTDGYVLSWNTSLLAGAGDYEWVATAGLANIQDETYGVSVTGKMAISTIDISSGINASPGSTFDLQGTTINFGSATIAGGNAFNNVIDNHLWSGSTQPTDGYVLSWDTSANSGNGDYEWVAQSGGSSSDAALTEYEFTATANQTSFAATYIPNSIQVFLNGVKLANTDFTATNGTSVVLGANTASGDIVAISKIGGSSNLTVANASASGAGAISYDSGSEILTYTPPDTSGFIAQQDAIQTEEIKAHTNDNIVFKSRFNTNSAFLDTTANTLTIGQSVATQSTYELQVNGDILVKGANQYGSMYNEDRYGTITPIGPTQPHGKHYGPITANGVSAYTFSGLGDNPTLTLFRGETYAFNLNASGHPFVIKTVAGTGTGNIYNEGTTNQGVEQGYMFFTVPLDAPDTLYYQCVAHSAMVGTINVTDRLNSFRTSGSLVTGFTSGFANADIARFYWNLPEAGDYMLYSVLRTYLWSTTGFIKCRLFNNTTGSAIAGTDRMMFEVQNQAMAFNVMSTPVWKVTVGAASTIYLQLNATTAAAGIQDDFNGYNEQGWMRVH